eukprot:TCONS_00005593-protein
MMKVILACLLVIQTVSCLPAMTSSMAMTSDGACADERSIYCMFMRTCFVSTFLQRCETESYLRDVCAKSCNQCKVECVNKLSMCPSYSGMCMDPYFGTLYQKMCPVTCGTCEGVLPATDKTTTTDYYTTTTEKQTTTTEETTTTATTTDPTTTTDYKTTTDPTTTTEPITTTEETTTTATTTDDTTTTDYYTTTEEKTTTTDETTTTDYYTTTEEKTTTTDETTTTATTTDDTTTTDYYTTTDETTTTA